MTEPTPAQLDYVEEMRNRLHLTKALLDNHCMYNYDKHCKDLDRGTMSLLIEEMKGWDFIPNQLLKEAGQQELPGLD